MEPTSVTSVPLLLLYQVCPYNLLTHHKELEMGKVLEVLNTYIHLKLYQARSKYQILLMQELG